MWRGEGGGGFTKYQLQMRARLRLALRLLAPLLLSEGSLLWVAQYQGGGQSYEFVFSARDISWAAVQGRRRVMAECSGSGGQRSGGI